MKILIIAITIVCLITSVMFFQSANTPMSPTMTLSLDVKWQYEIPSDNAKSTSVPSEVDHTQSMLIIESLLGCTELDATIILEQLRMANLPSIKSAHLAESENGFIVLFIVTEDERSYKIWMTKEYLLQAIFDAE